MARPLAVMVSIAVVGVFALVSFAPIFLGASAAGGRASSGPSSVANGAVNLPDLSVGGTNSTLASLTFTESGLGSGLRWNVTVSNSVTPYSNVTVGSSGDIVLSVLSNTTYYYTVQSLVPGGTTAYVPARDSGVVLVPPGGATVGVAYQGLPAYPAQFNETGLPNGVTWNISLQGTLGRTSMIPVGAYPDSLALDSATGQIFAVNSNSNNVSVIDSTSNLLLGSIPVGSLPRGVAYDPSNGYLYVLNLLSNNISVINGVTDKVVGSVPTGLSPVRDVFDPANGYLYVTNHNSSNVSVINAATDTVVGAIPAGNGPVGIALDSANGFLYVGNRFSDNVTVINGATNTVVTSIVVGAGPRFLTFDPLNGNVYVSNYDDGTVSVINATTDTVVGLISVGYAAHEATVDPKNGNIYLSQNTGSGTVTVINGTTDTVVGSIPVGSYPAGSLYDPTNGLLYVSDEFSDALTVINPATFYGNVGPVLLTNLTVGGGGAISIYLPNGSYVYTVSPTLIIVAGALYEPGSSSGSFTVSGAGMTFSVHYNRAVAYPVEFVESGLPNGTSWSVLATPTSGPALFGCPLDCGSNTTANGSGAIGLHLLNGSYSYSISPSNLTTGNTVYGLAVPFGAFTVAGGPVNVTVPYTRTPVYQVTFNASGLPDGVLWQASAQGENATVARIPVGAYPDSLAFDTATNRIFAVTSNSNNVSVIDPTSNLVVGSIPVGLLPRGVVYDPSNGELYILNLLTNNISVINGATDKVVGSVPTGYSPVRGVFDPANGYLYVTNHNSSNVSVINTATNTVVGSLPAGNGPVGIALDSANGYLYVGNRFSDNVTVINPATNTVVTSIVVGAGPRFLTFDPLNGNVYVSNYDDGTVSVINGATDTVVGSISVGYAAHEATVDPKNGYLYLSQNTEPGTVTVVNGTTDAVVGSIPVGLYPAGSLYDPTNGLLYVSDEFSNALTVIDPAVNDGGVAPASLPSDRGTDFSVNGTGSIVLGLVNGTYTFSIVPVVMQGVVYTPSPENGTLTVNGTSLSVAVTFSTQPLFNVTFRAAGLPAGTRWTGTSGPVPVSSANVTYGRSGTLRFQEAAGLAGFRFAATGYAVARVTGAGSPTLHSATIVGSQAFVVHFGALEPVTFSEVATLSRPGLPAHSAWTVTISQRFPDGSSQVVASATTNNTTALFALPAGGHYSYQVTKPLAYRAWGGHGSFTVPGHEMVRKVQFAPYTSRLVFVEVGLPVGWFWSVSLNGTANLFLSGTTPVLSVRVFNGTYDYSFSPVGAFFPTPGGGNLTVVAPLLRKVAVSY